MEYSEITKRLREQQPVKIGMVTCVQTFMLIYDSYILTIDFEDSRYEIHLIPTDDEAEDIIDITDEKYKTYSDALYLLATLFRKSKITTPYIMFNDEQFKVEFELVESK